MRAKDAACDSGNADLETEEETQQSAADAARRRGARGYVNADRDGYTSIQFHADRRIRSGRLDRLVWRIGAPHTGARDCSFSSTSVCRSNLSDIDPLALGARRASEVDRGIFRPSALVASRSTLASVRCAATRYWFRVVRNRGERRRRVLARAECSHQ